MGEEILIKGGKEYLEKDSVAIVISELQDENGQVNAQALRKSLDIETSRR